MVKVTVLYNLAAGADHAAFVRWRTTEHQRSNAAGPGVLRTDFYVAEPSPLGPPAYRYVTEVYYRTMDELERHFFDPAMQEKISRLVAEHRLEDFRVIVSREFAGTVNEG